MGVAQNIHDVEDGTLEIGMGMCPITLPVFLISNYDRIPFGCVYAPVIDK